MSVDFPRAKEGIRREAGSPPDELISVSYERVRTLLPILAVAYLFYAARWLLAMGNEALGWELYLGIGAGFGAALLWGAVRRGWIPEERTPLLVGGVALVALVHGLTMARHGNGTAAANVLFLLMVATGITVLTVSWQMFVSVGALGGWALTAWGSVAITDYFYWMIVLVCGAVLSGVTAVHRLGKTAAVEPTPSGTVVVGFRQEFADRAIEGTQDGLWYWELKSDVFHFSDAWAALLGFTPEELVKHPDEWMNRVHPGYVARLRAELSAHLHGDEPQFRNEHRMRRKDGTYMWVLGRGTAVRNEAGEPIVLAGSHSDITPLIEVEKRLLTDTFKDQLTGLANRNFLLSHLEMAVEERAARGTSAPLFALMFLDLDRFKFINDTMGHHVGDELLIAVAGRLRNCARPDDVVARFGGDEFVVLLRNLQDGEEAMHVGARMLKALTTPYQLGEREIQSGGSIGVALSREEFRKSEEILNFGDIAMYESKKNGKGRVTLFHRGMLEESSKQEQLQTELEKAVERGQLLLHYQPSVEIATGRIVGAEALLRWRRESGEMLYPAEFLPLAEKGELIHQIGEWVLRTACKQNRAWQEAGLSSVRVSVNLSPRQLQQRELAQVVRRVLDETKLRSEWLELEITEDGLMRNLDQAGTTLRLLADAGIRMAIDNFGSGNSSVTSLRQFPFQTLKMDRGIVSEINTDPKAAGVVRGLINMAHHLGIAVVAEGVERKEQFQFLAGEKCDNIQGFLTGPPVAAEDMAKLLRVGRSASDGTGTPTLGADLSSLNEVHKPTPNPMALKWAAERKARQ